MKLLFLLISITHAASRVPTGRTLCRKYGNGEYDQPSPTSSTYGWYSLKENMATFADVCSVHCKVEDGHYCHEEVNSANLRYSRCTTDRHCVVDLSSQKHYGYRPTERVCPNHVRKTSSAKGWYHHAFCACDAGSEIPADNWYCHQCQKGKYQNRWYADFRWNQISGATFARDGVHGVTLPAQTCKDCPSGWYTDQLKQQACKQCPTGKRSSTGDTKCLQNTCTCQGGTEVTGSACIQHGRSWCASCDETYQYVDGHGYCQYFHGTYCQNGVIRDVYERTAINQCGTCDPGYHLVETPGGLSSISCIANTCYCSNGVAATGPACTSNNANVCGTCADGYYLNTRGIAEIGSGSTYKKIAKGESCGNVTSGTRAWEFINDPDTCERYHNSVDRPSHTFYGNYPHSPVKIRGCYFENNFHTFFNPEGSTPILCEHPFCICVLASCKSKRGFEARQPSNKIVTEGGYQRYKTRTTGYCTDERGWGPISTIEECKEAIEKIGWIPYDYDRNLRSYELYNGHIHPWFLTSLGCLNIPAGLGFSGFGNNKEILPKGSHCSIYQECICVFAEGYKFINTGSCIDEPGYTNVLDRDECRNFFKTNFKNSVLTKEDMYKYGVYDTTESNTKVYNSMDGVANTIDFDSVFWTGVGLGLGLETYQLYDHLPYYARQQMETTYTGATIEENIFTKIRNCDGWGGGNSREECKNQIENICAEYVNTMSVSHEPQYRLGEIGKKCADLGDWVPVSSAADCKTGASMCRFGILNTFPYFFSVDQHYPQAGQTYQPGCTTQTFQHGNSQSYMWNEVGPLDTPQLQHNVYIVCKNSAYELQEFPLPCRSHRNYWSQSCHTYEVERVYHYVHGVTFGRQNVYVKQEDHAPVAAFINSKPGWMPSKEEPVYNLESVNSGRVFKFVCKKNMYELNAAISYTEQYLTEQQISTDKNNCREGFKHIDTKEECMFAIHSMGPAILQQNDNKWQQRGASAKKNGHVYVFPGFEIVKKPEQRPGCIIYEGEGRANILARHPYVFNHWDQSYPDLKFDGVGSIGRHTSSWISGWKGAWNTADERKYDGKNLMERNICVPTNKCTCTNGTPLGSGPGTGTCYIRQENCFSCDVGSVMERSLQYSEVQTCVKCSPERSQIVPRTTPLVEYGMFAKPTKRKCVAGYIFKEITTGYCEDVGMESIVTVEDCELGASALASPSAIRSGVFFPIVFENNYHQYLPPYANTNGMGCYLSGSTLNLHSKREAPWPYNGGQRGLCKRWSWTTGTENCTNSTGWEDIGEPERTKYGAGHVIGRSSDVVRPLPDMREDGASECLREANKMGYNFTSVNIVASSVKPNGCLFNRQAYADWTDHRIGGTAHPAVNGYWNSDYTIWTYGHSGLRTLTSFDAATCWDITGRKIKMPGPLSQAVLNNANYVNGSNEVPYACLEAAVAWRVTHNDATSDTQRFGGQKYWGIEDTQNEWQRMTANNGDYIDMETGDFFRLEFNKGASGIFKDKNNQVVERISCGDSMNHDQALSYNCILKKVPADFGKCVDCNGPGYSKTTGEACDYSFCPDFTRDTVSSPTVENLVSGIYNSNGTQFCGRTGKMKDVYP